MEKAGIVYITGYVYTLRRSMVGRRASLVSQCAERKEREDNKKKTARGKHDEKGERERENRHCYTVSFRSGRWYELGRMRTKTGPVRGYTVGGTGTGLQGKP